MRYARILAATSPINCLSAPEIRISVCVGVLMVMPAGALIWLLLNWPTAGQEPQTQTYSWVPSLQMNIVLRLDTLSAVLGRARMDVGELLRLGPGSVLELDRKVGEAIDIYVNNRLVARGEVVLVEDKLGVTMTEIIKAERS